MGSWGESAYGEEHAESVVLAVAVAAGEAAVQFDDAVERAIAVITTDGSRFQTIQVFSRVAQRVSAVQSNVFRFTRDVNMTIVGINFATLSGSTCATNRKLTIACGGSAAVPPGGAAITLGNVMTAGDSLTKFTSNDSLLRHETAHTWQWAFLGAFTFSAMWLAGGGAVCSNPIERAAGIKGVNVG